MIGQKIMRPLVLHIITGLEEGGAEAVGAGVQGARGVLEPAGALRRFCGLDSDGVL